MKNKKRIITLAAACALSALLAVGGTLAWLSDSTAVVTNTFTSSKKVAIDLKEPDWDGIGFEGETITKPAEGFGKEIASKYTPGTTIKKDPQIMNTSEDTKTWTAVKLAYVDNQENSITRAEFEELYGTINFDTTKWTYIGLENMDDEVYMYNLALDPGQKTETALFSSVTVNEDIQLVDNALPTFVIQATGYGVQYENITADDAPAELLKLME